MDMARPSCPRCGSEHVIKNGSIDTGKPKFACKECGRQFVQDPQQKIIPHSTWELVDRLLLERISIAGIARVTGISEQWLQHYINTKYKAILHHIEAPKKSQVRSHLSVTNSGHLWVTNRTHSGFGSHSMSRPAKS
jgi:insertion element IS1 protein InsB